MVWVKLDDAFVDHPKVDGLSDAAFRLFVSSLCHANRYLTDGFVATDRPPRLVARFKRALIDELVHAGLWSEVDGGWAIHDYLLYNPSRRQVEAERVSNARRQALFRNPDVRAAVRQRDNDRCRYCGEKVRWNDRRGPLSGTYDHVDPDGGNTVDNLVVCCRACNAAKGPRTPEQAGMVLVPIQSGSSYPTGTECVSPTAPARTRPTPLDVSGYSPSRGSGPSRSKLVTQDDQRSAAQEAAFARNAERRSEPAEAVLGGHAVELARQARQAAQTARRRDADA